jgi:hypothetical protein
MSEIRKSYAAALRPVDDSPAYEPEDLVFETLRDQRPAPFADPSSR